MRRKGRCDGNHDYLGFVYTAGLQRDTQGVPYDQLMRLCCEVLADISTIGKLTNVSEWNLDFTSAKWRV